MELMKNVGILIDLEYMWFVVHIIMLCIVSCSWDMRYIYRMVHLVDKCSIVGIVLYIIQALPSFSV